jgi:2-dehydro-3-deoxygalactonokinase
MKQLFLSSDWGTSSFRLRLVNAGAAAVLAELSTDDGVLKTHTEWKQQGSHDETRLGFYRAVLSAGIAKLQSHTGETLDSLPIIVSGMASANIGIKELPYKELPVLVDGTNLLTDRMAADKNFEHDILLVSGVCTTNDVMRGEEIQLAGALQDSHTEQVVIFPGTHSKHVHIAGGQIQKISTYMTGEFFELLSQKSILAGSVEQDRGVAAGSSNEAFCKGVEAGRDHSLLHSGFMVRINQLFGLLSKAENYYYLSGLLIGTEMKELAGNHLPVTIVADRDLRTWYALAAEVLGIQQPALVEANHAIVTGHTAIYKTHLAGS